MDRGGASFPFAWAFLLAQHFSFGLGGILVSIFDASYSYQNEQGFFSWEDAILPLLLIHSLALNAGLAGVILASPRTRLAGIANGWREHRKHGSMWQWEQLSGTCFVSLAMHLIIYIFFAPIKEPSRIVYFVQIFGQCTAATFILWGLVWPTCSRSGKWIFMISAAVFGLIEAIEGNRGIFAWPLVLFAVGDFVSTRGRVLNLRMALKWLPLVVILFLGVAKSEDVRVEFSRDTPTDSGEAMARLGALVSSPEESPLADQSGQNVFFRLGSRLFELSAADVVTRTPEDIPYWGWTNEDWSVLLNGFLPLKSKSNADFISAQDAAVIFLQDYGWIYVAPSQGSSMPATMVGDSWRRFGWIGVATLFGAWSWMLAKVSLNFRFSPQHLIPLMVGLALAAEIWFDYVSDMISLVNSLPRHIAIMVAYSVVVWGFQLLLSHRGQHLSNAIGPRSASGNLATSDVPFTRR
jgi:hypothetical protein